MQANTKRVPSSAILQKRDISSIYIQWKNWSLVSRLKLYLFFEYNIQKTTVWSTITSLTFIKIVNIVNINNSLTFCTSFFCYPHWIRKNSSNQVNTEHQARVSIEFEFSIFWKHEFRTSSDMEKSIRTSGQPSLLGTRHTTSLCIYYISCN